MFPLDSLLMVLLIASLLPLLVSILRLRGQGRPAPWTVAVGMGGALVICSVLMGMQVFEGSYWVVIPWVSVLLLGVVSWITMAVPPTPLPEDPEAREVVRAVNAKRAARLSWTMIAAAIVAFASFLVFALIVPLVTAVTG